MAAIPNRLDGEQLLDVPGAAALLHITPRAVRQAVYRGTLPTPRLGRWLRFRRADLSRDPSRLTTTILRWHHGRKCCNNTSALP
jgi:excisionase family DNA binding protein